MQGTKRLKVLVSAYACNPNQGSEEGVGWGWVNAPQEAHELGRFQVAGLGEDEWVVLDTRTGANCRISLAKQEELFAAPDSAFHKRVDAFKEMYLEQGFDEQAAQRIAIEHTYSDCFAFPEYSIPVWRDR